MWLQSEEVCVVKRLGQMDGSENTGLSHRRSMFDSSVKTLCFIHDCSTTLTTCTFRDKVRSSDIWRELGVELLLLRTERKQLRWFEDLNRRFSRHVHLVRHPSVDPGHTGQIIYQIWPGSPRRSWKMLLGRHVDYSDQSAATTTQLWLRGRKWVK